MLNLVRRHDIVRPLRRGAWAVMDVVAGLLLLGAGQGLFLAALLVLRPQLRTAANLFLAALVGVQAISCLDDAVRYVGGYAPNTFAAALPLFLLPLFGPLLRFHLDALLVRGEWRFEARHRRWLVTPLIAWGLIVCFLALAGRWSTVILIDAEAPDTPPVLAAMLCLVAVYLITAAQVGAAILWGLRQVRQADLLDDATASRLVWLRGLLLVTFVCWAGFVVSLTAGFIDTDAERLADGWSSVLYAASLYALGLLGLARPDTLLPAPGEIVATILEPARTSKYAKSAMTEDDSRRLAARIEALFARDKPYLDPGLTLPKLARLVDASSNDTSQAINTALGCTYNDLINRWRIEDAKQRLADPANEETILDICFAVGFNSKSVFNAAFKRLTGETPSAFRDRVRTGGQDGAAYQAATGLLKQS